MNTVKKRDFLFDNIKGFLILLVVFGHVIENYTHNNTYSIVSLLYLLIYVFHMPLFVFINGYFSKKDNPKKLAELLIIYVFFQLIFFPVVSCLIKGETYLDNVQSFFKPEFTYWYILSLIGWRTLNPVLIKIKFIFPLSIIAGILIGLTPGEDSLVLMSIGRSISFYPFFLTGYLMNKDDIKFIREQLYSKKAYILLAFLVAISILFFTVLSTFLIKYSFLPEILFGEDRYSSYLTNPNSGILFRLFLYFIQFLFICAFISLFTSKKTILSKLSLHSLFIYLTHGVLVDSLGFKYYYKFDVSDMGSVSFLIMSLIISLAYCFLLSTKPLSKIGTLITKLPSYLINDEKKSRIK